MQPAYTHNQAAPNDDHENDLHMVPSGSISTTLTQEGFGSALLLNPKSKKRKADENEVHGASPIVRSTWDRTCRHSKVCTSGGVIRDRRVRLSPNTAIQFYDVQDRLGFNRPSETIDWLLKEAKGAIDALDEPRPPLANSSSNNNSNNSNVGVVDATLYHSLVVPGAGPCHVSGSGAHPSGDFSPLRSGDRPEVAVFYPGHNQLGFCYGSATASTSHHQMFSATSDMSKFLGLSANENSGKGNAARSGGEAKYPIVNPMPVPYFPALNYPPQPDDVFSKGTPSVQYY